MVPCFLGSLNLGVGYSVHLHAFPGAAEVCVGAVLASSWLPVLLLLGGLCLKVASVP